VVIRLCLNTKDGGLPKDTYDGKTYDEFINKN